MEHLSDARIIEHIVDDSPWSDQEAAHLGGCQACAELLEEFGALQDALQLAQRSAVSEGALARYDALFAHVEPSPGPVEQVRAAIQAVLAWDGRAAFGGVRRAAAADYRLLYSAGEHDIELMVESDGGLRHLTGEVLLAGAATAPLLIELSRQTPHGADYVVATTVDGRFQLKGVAPGSYRFLATPSIGVPLAIESLPIT